MRKCLLFICLVVSATVLNSCLDSTNPQHSPEIYCSLFYVNPVFEGDSLLGAKDTLDLLSYDSDAGWYRTDTAYVGDTVMFASEYYTVANNLVSVKVDWEKLSMNLWCPISDGVRKVLTAESDTMECKFCFDPGYNNVSFPVYFVPLQQAGMTLKLTVKSDSEYSTSSVQFYIPAKEQVVDSVALN